MSDFQRDRSAPKLLTPARDGEYIEARNAAPIVHEINLNDYMAAPSFGAVSAYVYDGDDLRLSTLGVNLNVHGWSSGVTIPANSFLQLMSTGGWWELIGFAQGPDV